MWDQDPGMSRRAPELERHVIARKQVPPVVAELQVRDAGDDLAEEAPRAWRLRLRSTHAQLSQALRHKA